MEQDRFSILRWSLFSLVFFGIPVLLVCFWFNQGWKERKKVQSQRLNQSLDRLIGFVEVGKDPVDFMSDLLRLAVRKVVSSGDPKATWKILSKHLKKRFPGVFSFIFLDGNGEPVTDLCDIPPVSRKVLRNLFTAFNDNPKLIDKDLLKRDKKYFKQLLGPLIQSDGIRDEWVNMASYKAEKGFVFVSRGYPGKGMLIAFLNQLPDWSTIGLRDRLNILARRGNTYPIGIIDNRHHFLGQVKQFGEAADDVVWADGVFQRLPLDVLDREKYLWVQRTVSPTVRVLAAGMKPQGDVFSRSRNRLVIACVLFFALASFASLKIMRGSWTLYLSIRWKLVLLFLYAAGVPLAVMGIAAGNYFAERRNVLENEIFLQTEKALRVFDTQFPKLIGNLEKTVNDILHKPLPPGIPLFEIFKGRMKKIEAEVRPTTCALADESGKPVYRTDRDQGKIPLKTLQNMIANILRNMNVGEAKLDEIGDDVVTSSIAAVGGMDLEALFSNLARSIGIIGEFRMGNMRSLLMLTPVFDQAGKARYLALIGWGRDHEEREYTGERLAILESQLVDTVVYAPNNRMEGWSHPANFKFKKILTPFRKKLRAAGAATYDRLRIGKESYLLTGITCQELIEFHLIAMTSDRRINEEIRAQWFQLGFISLGLMAISTTVGMLLARKFLLPVGNLAMGVAALRNRNFEMRIPVVDRDELGDLSETFNEMIGGLADLEVARIVQESLFPTEPLVSGRFSVFGSCLPAAQVGGDYFDYFPISEGRIAIILGDVSGHGVSAALVMGMAKALVAHPSNEFDPSKILTVLNHVFVKTLKKKKMMTCLFAIVDLSGNKLLFSNAGQSFPFLIRGNEARMVEFAARPLGISQKTKYENLEVPLNDGDRLVFYSDGLVEANLKRGGPVGYDYFKKVLPELMQKDAQETERNIRHWHQKIILEGALDDDISLVIAQIG